MNEVAGISDDAVRAATGKTWTEWLAILDAAGAQQMSHKEIVAHLNEHYDISGWWQQTVAVGYEQARGLRQKHETAQGFQVSGSKTVGVPLPSLYAAWQDQEVRSQWLPNAAFTIRKATPSKSMRITWMDDTAVSVNFYARGDAKSQVSVEHSQLPDAGAAERMKAFWKERLQTLKQVLES